MIDLSKNPFSDSSGNPKNGKELDWLKWNGEMREKNNPYFDSNGSLILSKIDEFSEYRKNLQKHYQEDLKKLPLNIRQEIEKETRLLSERMQVEATGHR